MLVFMFFRDAEFFFFSHPFNFGSLSDCTATILFLFLGKVARNGYICVLSAVILGLHTLGDPLHLVQVLTTVFPVLSLAKNFGWFDPRRIYIPLMSFFSS